MTKEEILNKVQEIVSEQLDIEPQEVVLTADIKEDLEADESIKTIQDVVNHVATQVAAAD